MELDCSLCPLEPCPVEDRRTKIDCGSIEREQRTAEPKLVPRSDGLATRIQTLKDISIEFPRPMSVGVCQRRPFRRPLDPGLLAKSLCIPRPLPDLKIGRPHACSP